MRSDPSGEKIIEKVQTDGEGVDNTSPEEHQGADGHVDVVDNGVDNDSSVEKDDNGGSKDEMKLEDKPIHADIIAESSLNDSKERTVDVNERIEPKQKQIVSPRRRDRLEKLRKKRIDAVNASRNSIWVQTQTNDVAEVTQPSIETDQTPNREKEEVEKPTTTSTDIKQVGKEVDHVSATNEIEIPAPPATLQVQLEDSEGPMTMSPSPRDTDNVEKQDAEPGPEEAITIEKGDEGFEGGNTEGGEALKQPDATLSSLDNYIDLSSSSSTSCNDDDDKYSVINSNKSEDLIEMDKHERTEKTEVEFESSVGTSIKRPQFNKTNRQISDERALTNSSSNLTTASQVTIKHGNTTNKGLKNPVPTTNSMVSLNSDISSLNPDEGTLGSEEYKREIERLRMRKIKLQSVAVSVGMNHDIEPMETLTEVSKLSSSEHDIVLSDSKKSDELDTAILQISTQNKSDNVPKRGEYNASSAPVESRPCDNGLERLIMVAMIGMIGGVLGSMFAYDTCEFVSIRKKVGYYDEILQVSAGMKYFTSIDSVFTGSQCIAYDHENLYYTQEPPHFAKISSLSGIACGVTSVVILWFYILTKKTTTKIWNIASAFSCIASLAQILTFQFYFSSVCKEETCTIGEGTVASFIAAMSYGCIGYEMIGNKPNKRIPHVLGEKLIKNDGDDDDHYKAPSIV